MGAWRVRSRQSLGAYGAVYLATLGEQPDGAPVALKVAIHANDPRFLREAELLRRVRHPHVPCLHDHGLWAHPAGPFPFLVMDWVEGVSLYAWAHERAFSSREVMRLLAPMASALAATHAAGCVHRDIKGDNILVSQDGSRPMLLDFGAGDFLGAPTLTREVLPPGTPYYRSPEALRFHWRYRHQPGAHYEPEPADDVYALGVTAYCLVTGSYPPPVLPPELLETEPSLRAEEWEPPEARMTACPELSGLIRQMLSLKPLARGTAADVAEALEHAARTAGPEADQPILRQHSGQSGTAPRTEVHQRVEWGAQLQVNPPTSQNSITESVARKNRTGLPSSARVLRLWLAMAAGVLAIIALQKGWPPQRQPAKPPGQDMSRPKQSSDREDAGTSGLGDDAVAIRIEKEEPRPAGDGLNHELPQTPLPGQAQPPCKGREIKINGACWARMGAPPCGEREYEWQGLCYSPVLALSPPATSKQQQER
ncbi:MAG: serine/threonine protein kinase [Hyalangium sp.]|uniref:serine/threonine protein kinase n=1 Tax=Hyalangium sp. TaxID=2028555 RepID=UPI00389A9148